MEPWTVEPRWKTRKQKSAGGTGVDENNIKNNFKDGGREYVDGTVTGSNEHGNKPLTKEKFL